MEVGVPKFEPPGALAREFWIQWKSACVEPRGRVTGRKVLKKIRRENFEKIISKMSTNTGLNGGGGPQVRAPGCPSQGVLNPMKISVCRAEGKSQKSFKENSSGKFWENFLQNVNKYGA